MAKAKTTKPATAEKAKTPTAKKPATSTTKKPATAKKPAATAKTKPATTKKAETPVAEKAPTVPEKVKNVLFITTEAIPFATTGGMGEVCTNLARALNKSGKTEARVMLPLYEDVAYHFKDQMKFVCNITVGLAWRNQYCGLFQMEYEGVTYYFVDNEYYFKRVNIYGYYDDAERFAFFSRAALDLLPYLDFKPDILQSNDHLTALVPIYYRLHYKERYGYEHIKNLFTIHNINYQGIYPLVIAGDVFGLSEAELPLVEFNGKINLVKGAIVTCDKITTMSPQYALEIRMPEFAGGLDGMLVENREKIVGILNGIDTELHDPATSESLFYNYDVKTAASRKKMNKLELQRMLSLPEDENIPLVCMIAHMVPFKGYDLLRKSINKQDGNILDMNIQLVLLGQGDPDIEGYLSHIQNMYNGKIRSLITFNRDLAHKVLAAADICLVPSRMEPCGLTQMCAARFGAVPVVRATGGLIDSIKDCGDGTVGNGFMFEEYDSDVLDAAITRAVTLYSNKKVWDGLVTRAMSCDFSWNMAAHEYNVLYRALSV